MPPKQHPAAHQAETKHNTNAKHNDGKEGGKKLSGKKKEDHDTGKKGKGMNQPGPAHDGGKQGGEKEQGPSHEKQGGKGKKQDEEKQGGKADAKEEPSGNSHGKEKVDHVDKKPGQNHGGKQEGGKAEGHGNKESLGNKKPSGTTSAFFGIIPPGRHGRLEYHWLPVAHRAVLFMFDDIKPNDLHRENKQATFKNKYLQWLHEAGETVHKVGFWVVPTQGHHKMEQHIVPKDADLPYFVGFKNGKKILEVSGADTNLKDKKTEPMTKKEFEEIVNKLKH